MTIKEYVLSFEPMGINGWLGQIEKDGFKAHEKEIIGCAEHFEKIVINHDASFKDCVR